MMNKGTINDTLSQLDTLTLAKMNLAMQTLSTTPSYVFLLSGIERISAMMAQVSLSVLVWFAVKYKHKKYFFLALLFHLLWPQSLSLWHTTFGVISIQLL